MICLDGSLLTGAALGGTHLEGADLRTAEIGPRELAPACGNRDTQLPSNVPRPKWKCGTEGIVAANCAMAANGVHGPLCAACYPLRTDRFQKK